MHKSEEKSFWGLKMFVNKISTAYGNRYIYMVNSTKNPLPTPNKCQVFEILAVDSYVRLSLPMEILLAGQIITSDLWNRIGVRDHGIDHIYAVEPDDSKLMILIRLAR
jgi:hypothetical protein